MITRAFIDWISFTVPITHTLSFVELWDKVASITHTERRLWTRCNALYGYDMAFTFGVGIIAMAHSARSEMGVHFQVSGQGIETLLGNTGVIYVTLDELNEIGAKVTRIDIAIDVFDSGLLIEHIARAVDDDETIKSSSKHMTIKSSNGGETLYVGSRQSERFLRIYNKAAERLAANADNSQSSDWIRVELEVKGDKAKALHWALSSSDQTPSQTIASWISGFLNFPQIPLWGQILGEPKTHMEISHRKLTNSRKWLLGTVCQSIAKEWVKDRDFHTDLERALEDAIWKEMERTHPDERIGWIDVKIIVEL